MRVLDDLGLIEDGRSDIGYLWRGVDLVVETSSNPITGLQAINHQGEPEYGYASYMQANGTPDAIRRFMVAVQTYAIMIKGDAPTEVTGVAWPR